MKSLPHIIVITGPTAVGKTRVAIKICSKLNGELISADSMQIYKGLTIGTAKSTQEELQGTPCHLIDIAEPTDEFNLAQFIELADKSILSVASRGKIPIIVGGTGLYLKGLLFGIFKDKSKNPAIRSEIKQRMISEGPSKLHRELEAIDPLAASRINHNDKLRIERALEVYHTTGKSISSLQQEWLNPIPRYSYNLFILIWERRELYRRIEQRIDQMLQDGWLEEVKGLLDRYPLANLHCFKSIGYRKIITYLKGEVSYSEMVNQIMKETRHYAKRQLTWFRKMPHADWINLSNESEDYAVEYIYNHISLNSGSLEEIAWKSES